MRLIHSQGGNYAIFPLEYDLDRILNLKIEVDYLKSRVKCLEETVEGLSRSIKDLQSIEHRGISAKSQERNSS